MSNNKAIRIEDEDSSLTLIHHSACFVSLTQSRTLTLPPLNTSHMLGKSIVIKDLSGQCSDTRKIIVQGSGSDKIDNMNSVSLEEGYACLVVFPGCNSTWVVTSKYEDPSAYSS